MINFLHGATRIWMAIYAIAQISRKQFHVLYILLSHLTSVYSRKLCLFNKRDVKMKKIYPSNVHSMRDSLRTISLRISRGVSQALFFLKRLSRGLWHGINSGRRYKAEIAHEDHENTKKTGWWAREEGRNDSPFSSMDPFDYHFRRNESGECCWRLPGAGGKARAITRAL